jgi:hypothetical protein
MRAKAVLTAILAVVFVAACNTSTPTDVVANETSELPFSTPSKAQVLYEVEGTTDYADVTVATPTGTEQVSPDIPMARKTGEAGLEVLFSRGEFVYILAQNNRSHGTISCRITVDGVVISENESKGGYAIVTCEGIAE